MGTDLRPGTAPRIQLHAADLRYGNTTIFEALDLTLPAGRTTCLLGPSGVGKTSLLRLIAGLAHGAEGQAEDETGKTLDGRIAYLAQQDLLLPWFSVLNNVLLGPRLRDEPVTGALERRARDLIAQVGLAGLEADRPGRLSGGMRQRVVAAMGLATNPELLIADEPTTSLDVTIQAQFLGLIRGLQREHQTSVIWVTHDLGIVAQMCDRVNVMYAGRIVESGEVRKIYKDPQHPYTKALLDSVPIMGNPRTRLYQIDGQPPDLRNIPTGCTFWPRCPSVMDICKEQYPPTTPTGGDDFVHCWLAEK